MGENPVLASLLGEAFTCASWGLLIYCFSRGDTNDEEGEEFNESLAGAQVMAPLVGIVTGLFGYLYLGSHLSGSVAIVHNVGMVVMFLATCVLSHYQAKYDEEKYHARPV